VLKTYVGLIAAVRVPQAVILCISEQETTRLPVCSALFKQHTDGLVVTGPPLANTR
jgi:hypothetical protein